MAEHFNEADSKINFAIPGSNEAKVGVPVPCHCFECGVEFEVRLMRKAGDEVIVVKRCPYHGVNR